jgi:glycosyltransferase involved in cell wall biosynthesis
MEKFISVIIPNYNGSSFIGKCLEAAFASNYGNFEVIVVDDCSTDDSVEIIKRYPCRLVRLEKHAGPGAARNEGANNSRGEVFFFTDADCLLRRDALARANQAATEHPGAVIGGTYTPLPFDDDFFSAFQSLFIHYSETRKKEPDYIAAHAMIMDAALFQASTGFRRNDLPMPEDVELSHKLRRSGHRLVMEPGIQVQHIFRFTLMRSLVNAFRKSMYWTMYSLGNRDLLADSGTASTELKVNTGFFFVTVLLAVLSLRSVCSLAPLISLVVFNLAFSRKLLKLFFRAKGPGFGVLATLYYAGAYPAAVGAGALLGLVRQVLMRS